MAENFTVPSNPRENGAIVFLFPSFEAGGSIIQPVLDWDALTRGLAGST